MQTNITQCQAGSPGFMVRDGVVVDVAVVGPGSRVIWVVVVVVVVVAC